MKISLNWLRDFVDCQLPASELETLLRRAGLEVAGIEVRGAAIDHVVVAEILESTQHPNADRLSVCRVNDGSDLPRQIVCGAKNYKVGDKVPLALPGAVMPGNFKIKTGKLRGIESEGMMCSAKELGLAEDSEGLLILPSDSQPGTPIKNLFPPETLMELEITPNRPDWLHHHGVAREVAVFTGLDVRSPAATLPATAPAGDLVSLQDAGCPFYTLRRISGVKVGPSPQWLVDRLTSVGLRSINNIVDVTNYVLFELGQPLHAFDASKIQGSIQVRRACSGEVFRALDGRDYTLNPDYLAIADQNGPVALAGVMGGETSGVGESTTDILLESAIFEPALVRRASRTLGLMSDSSYRFERGVDPDTVALASARAAELIVQVAGGKAEEVLFIAGVAPIRNQVELRHARVSAILGLPLSPTEIEAALVRVGLKNVSSTADKSLWEIPGFRRELLREADLIEEISRMVGIEKIPSRAVGIFAPASEADLAYDFAMDLRRRLAGLGFHEARTSTLVSVAAATGPAVELKNPFGDDQSRLRNSLIPGLLAALSRNSDLGSKSIPLFETGRIFLPEGEFQRLALVVTGETAPADWRGGSPRSWDVFDLMGVIRHLVGNREEDIRPVENPPAPFGAAADVFLQGNKIGTLGPLHPAKARELGVSSPVLVAEFDMSAWISAVPKARQASALPKFPGSSRDIAFLAARSLPFGKVRSAIRDLNEPLLEDVRLFDFFTDDSGNKIPADKKSLAVALTFRSLERTLMTDEVNAATDRIKAALRESLGVDFRE